MTVTKVILLHFHLYESERSEHISVKTVQARHQWGTNGVLEGNPVLAINRD